MPTKVLVYGYFVGVSWSRKIQRRLIEDVAFRVLAAGNQPDFRTIADFRKRHLAALAGFFEQVTAMLLTTMGSALATHTGRPSALLAPGGLCVRGIRLRQGRDRRVLRRA